MPDFKTIFDIINPNALVAYYDRVRSNTIPYLGSTLFPSKQKLGLKLEWIKGFDSLPIALQPSAFDTKPPLRDRLQFSGESTKMPFFREAMRLGEEDRQNLLMFQEANSSAYAASLIEQIYADTANLIAGAEVIPEIMRIALLYQGKFTIAAGADTGRYVDYTYNYDPSGEWNTKNFLLKSGVESWSDYTNSNPAQDIIKIKEAARKRGIVLTRMIVGYETWLDMAQNKKILLAMNPVAGQNIIPTEELIKTYYQTLTGIRIQIYDKLYKDTGKVDSYFYPQRGQATFLPDNTLGTTWYGTTPEQADLMSGNTLAQVAITNVGVAVSTEKIALPVNIVNWVSEIVLPSFESMNSVFNLKYS